MRLDPDLIRDLIIYVEDHSSLYMPIDSKDLCAELVIGDTDFETIAYHVNQLFLAGYFTKVEFTFDPAFYIHDLTPIGHEFAQNIRSDTVWNSVKDKASAIGSFSLKSLQAIAVNVVSSLISSRM